MQQALAQEPPAHSSRGLVEHPEQRSRFAQRYIVGEHRLDELQVAHRNRVKQHAFRSIVMRGAVEMIERGALRVAQIVQDGPRGTDGSLSARQSLTIE